MPTMVIGGEDGVLRVLPFQHPRRVRDADVEAAIRGELLGGFDHSASWMLLEDVPDHLNGPDVALPLAKLHCFVQPSYRGTERSAPDADQAFILHLAQLLPDRGVAHVLHLDVVKLEDIDVVCLEALQTLVEREAHIVAVELLRQLTLSASCGLCGGIVDVVSDLGRIQHIGSLSAKSLRELPLATTAAVGVGGVE